MRLSFSIICFQWKCKDKWDAHTEKSRNLLDVISMCNQQPRIKWMWISISIWMLMLPSVFIDFVHIYFVNRRFVVYVKHVLSQLFPTIEKMNTNGTNNVHHPRYVNKSTIIRRLKRKKISKHPPLN